MGTEATSFCSLWTEGDSLSSQESAVARGGELQHTELGNLPGYHQLGNNKKLFSGRRLHKCKRKLAVLSCLNGWWRDPFVYLCSLTAFRSQNLFTTSSHILMTDLDAGTPAYTWQAQIAPDSHPKLCSSSVVDGSTYRCSSGQNRITSWSERVGSDPKP